MAAWEPAYKSVRTPLPKNRPTSTSYAPKWASASPVIKREAAPRRRSNPQHWALEAERHGRNSQDPHPYWSGRPDLNRRPLPPQGSALPPALRPDGNNYSGNSEARLSLPQCLDSEASPSCGDFSPKGDLDIHVGTSEEPAEATRFLPYPGCDASRYGGKLRNTDAETI